MSIDFTSVAVAGQMPGSQACEYRCYSLRIWPEQHTRPAARLSLEDSSSHHSEWPPLPAQRTHISKNTQTSRSSDSMIHG